MIQSLVKFSFLFCLSFLVLGLFFSCTNDTAEDSGNNEIDGEEEKESFYLGADLSYVNEMEDCGGDYQVSDVYSLFAASGCDLVRLRLWHSPEWTHYSNYRDVVKSIRRAKSLGMKVLLDFHYSDDWADPSKQIRPAAWKNINDIQILGDSVYNYTRTILLRLEKLDLLPEMVQVGNEINSEILLEVPAAQAGSINWSRNISLLNRGMQAVKEVSKESGVDIQVMIHIAQPENAFWWFDDALKAGLSEFDLMGISYYPKWSDYPIERMSEAIDSLQRLYDVPVMIVETAYPHTLADADGANNILGADALIDGYPATPDGQLKYLTKLVEEVRTGHGCGVIYWEPAWISTSCSTRWGDGSHWDNATFFDAVNDHAKLPGFEFFNL